MMKTYFFVVLFIDLISSNLAWQEDCSICELNDNFNQLNGYGCKRISDNETICTCPDQQLSTINQPCRICNRKEICGSKTNLCSEQSSFLKPTNGGPYFACFCSSGSFLIGQICPDIIITTTSSIDEITISSNITTNLTKETRTDSITTTVFINETTTIPIATIITSTKVISCVSSHLYIESLLIILLNLVYFFNK